MTFRRELGRSGIEVSPMGIDWKSERAERRLKQVEAIREVLTSDGRSMAQGALGWGRWLLSL